MRTTDIYGMDRTLANDVTFVSTDPSAFQVNVALGFAAGCIVFIVALCTMSVPSRESGDDTARIGFVRNIAAIKDAYYPALIQLRHNKAAAAARFDTMTVELNLDMIRELHSQLFTLLDTHPELRNSDISALLEDQETLYHLCMEFTDPADVYSTVREYDSQLDELLKRLGSETGPS